MRYIILDANVIFSSLLKGKALYLLIELKKRGFELVTPQFLIEEFARNVNELSKALGISLEETILSFGKLLRIVKVVPLKQYSKFLERAKKISPDVKDVPYFALSLAFNKVPIWSREPRLKRQKVIKVLSDKEVKELLRD